MKEFELFKKELEKLLLINDYYVTVHMMKFMENVKSIIDQYEIVEPLSLIMHSNTIIVTFKIQIESKVYKINIVFIRCSDKNKKTVVYIYKRFHIYIENNVLFYPYYEYNNTEKAEYLMKIEDLVYFEIL